MHLAEEGAKQAPVETGDLRGSLAPGGPDGRWKDEADGLSMTVGSDLPYAAVQHEDLTLNHGGPEVPGGKAQIPGGSAECKPGTLSPASGGGSERGDRWMNLIRDIAAYLAETGNPPRLPYRIHPAAAWESGDRRAKHLLSKFPDYDGAPDGMIALFEYAGRPLDALDSAFAGLSLQVVTRDPDYVSGLTRAQTVSAMLRVTGDTDNGIPPLSINGATYYRFAALQSPFKLKEDDRGRLYFVQNFRVWARDNM